MTSNQGFKLHPEAARDITDIWEYIAEENPLAAGRVREDILDAIRKLVPFPDKATDGRILAHSRYVTRLYAITSSPTRLKKKPLLVIAVLHGSRNPRVIAAILSGRK
jgi:plasmid stabilization system protein ParE